MFSFSLQGLNKAMINFPSTENC